MLFEEKQSSLVSKLFCVLNFFKIVACSSVVGFMIVRLALSGCCFLRVYRYNEPWVFDQSQRTYLSNSGELFTCGLKT